MSQRHPVWVAENRVKPCNNSVLAGCWLEMSLSLSFMLFRDDLSRMPLETSLTLS